MNSDNEQLYFGGDVYTVDSKQPRAEAVAVKDGRIVAVGSKGECRAALGKSCELIDLRGRALLPGFIDTHLHLLIMIYYDMNVDLRGITSMNDLQEKIRAMAATTAPDKWIVCLDFDEQGIREKRTPTRHDLDAACADRPVVVIRHDGHTVIGNTKAIEAANASAATPDPEGGVIDREKDGSPAGPFREMAQQMILNAMPMPDIPSLMVGADKTFSKLIANGVTSIGTVMQTGEDGPGGKFGAYDVLAMKVLLDRLPLNFYGIVIADDMSKVEAARNALVTKVEQGHRRVSAVKLFADGTFGSCTAYMRRPFSDQPDKSGFMVVKPDDLYRRMAAAHNAGLQICIHAIGDAGNRTCVDMYDRLQKEFPRPDHRHRIEHASVLDAGTIADMARLGLIVSTQPMFIHSEKHWLHKRLGAERAKQTYPFRSILDGGVKIAGASDAPVESIDVLHAIYCCVTREGFETQQNITAAEAVRMFTIDAAYAQFEDSIKGSISVGKRADMIVLSQNPVDVPPEKIRNIRVERTIIGGKTFYQTQK